MRLKGFLYAAGTTLALLPVGDCASAMPVEGPVRLGQIAAVNGPHVRPEQLIEDSRCPVNVQCIQAGRLIVRATVLGGEWSRSVDLTLGVPVQVADGSLTLVSATSPLTAGKRRGNQRSYRFAFNFQGGL
ncbi:hypothetical protein [Sphingomonas immobilis]|uniref:Uncharacterized protein n=1 Tax=Sphingomonas immobilis TaxID=3063997 RepID=A0ABT8ZWC0_9SPHN|nr:hypothetical protein [Sphingomonas sp. CA1-15]MDO7841854.1 hypothetical protein [Sphingomonas sp. CA1-15]